MNNSTILRNVADWNYKQADLCESNASCITNEYFKEQLLRNADRLRNQANNCLYRADKMELAS